MATGQRSTNQVRQTLAFVFEIKFDRETGMLAIALAIAKRQVPMAKMRGVSSVFINLKRYRFGHVLLFFLFLTSFRLSSLY